MIPARKRHGWLTAGDLLKPLQYQTGLRAERLAVLNAVWEREYGHMARHWRLRGVRRGVLYVSPRSPAAALELRMQAPAILRALNKHFRWAWIRSIKPEASEGVPARGFGGAPSF